MADTDTLPDAATFDFDSEGADLAPKQKAVKYRGKDYILREADGPAAMAYRDAAVAPYKFKDGELAGFGAGLARVEYVLVSRCLYQGKELEVKDDRVTNPPVGEATLIQTWKPGQVKQMFEWLKKISPDLDEAPTLETIDKQMAALQKRRAKIVEAEAAKNARSNGTTAGSD